MDPVMENMENVPDEANRFEFTNNDIFETLVDKDTTTDITGFVSEVNAAKDVGARNQYRLFKFALSNIDVPVRKIYCCIWGQDLINKFESQILPNKIVRVSGATTKVAKSNYAKTNEGFVPFELNINASTVLTYYGFHNVIEPVVRDPVQVDFLTIAAQENGTLVTMTGFMKLPFRAIQSRYGNMSYGNSAITNGSEKVNVNVTNYAPMDIPLGMLLTVTGILDNEDQAGPTTIVCPTMENIVQDPEGRIMEPLNLQKGNRFPKRKTPTN